MQYLHTMIRVSNLDQSLARHDVFYEPEAEILRKLQPALARGDDDFDVDLFGTKPQAALSRAGLLSPRRCNKGIGFALREGAPPVASILAGAAGSFFHLARRDMFGSMSLARRHALIRASQVGSPLNALMFQLLKPLQIEMLIARQARAARKAAPQNTAVAG